MSAPTSLKPGDPIKAGEFEVTTADERSSIYGPDHERLENHARWAKDPAMKANRAALPKPPPYAGVNPHNWEPVH